jgi:hypothetical protein
MFSSRWLTELVPGISSIRSYRASNHARAIWVGVEPCLSATRTTAGSPASRAGPPLNAEPKGGKRHQRDLALLGKVDHLVVLTVDDAVAVLDPGHVDELKRELHLGLIDVGEPYQIELAVLAHVLERRQLLLERYGGVVSSLNDPQVHEVQTLTSK